MECVEVIPSDSFTKQLKEISYIDGTPEHIKKFFNSDEDSEDKLILSSEDIAWCHRTLTELESHIPIHELLMESQIHVPEYQPPPRNPELEERVRKLRLEQEDRDYKAMVKNVNYSNAVQSDLSQVGADLRAMNKQLVTGAQYLLSVVGTFFALFFAFGMVSDDYGGRALIATLGAVGVALAEVYFIIRDDLREERKLLKKD
ncbi:vacuolar ATPase assembly protein VMA12 [Oratosquilla oratoria]|uniref:vacuolar ATPase assembly protein VMA12 n=1 Tax=Oratosquilla oratoria TaxID=337810 RepID=UPI003F76665D